MARIVVTEFVSLDGVMEEPRWTFDFDRGPEGDKFKVDELFDAESLLLGRLTYQGFAAAWPAMDHDEFGKRMNRIRKYVVSSTLSDADATWGETTVLRGDPISQVRRLREELDGSLLVEGSSQLVHALTEHRLVDEYRLMIFPVILGSGKRLFANAAADVATLALTSSAAVGSGVLLLTYSAA